MKKLSWILLVLVVAVLTACGQDDKASNSDSGKQKETTEAETTNKEITVTASNAVDERLKEPTKDSLCEYCNMEVYEATHEYGAFSVQGIKKDGATAFFDDIGCMLNQERVDGAKMDKFVRDFTSKDWLKLDEAVIVQGDIKTPMSYGFAFFKDQEGADAFIADNKGAKVVDVSVIDEIAHERYKKKMEKMKNKDSESKMDKGSHGHDDSKSDSDKHNH
ncbi:nitrous oxide reductase accessory protein NosL [Viridibacillus sp. YIM B01967]|uniref:Nitrous oxide reductase accessory protein NosL n=1 Tax=Viridibacillus soli TaxID=2798301 RepID=A0ABS1H9Z6_9BACL|nr:nitrous oxide reductase accessory protein NosL [Viridibacillus soli]MBK3496225.1 nitrous oxide reductase accessory protein NosL [Viridibacillus soli]